MFDDLEEAIKRDENADLSPRNRWIRKGVVLMVSLLLFGGLYLIIKFVEA